MMLLRRFVLIALLCGAVLSGHADDRVFYGTVVRVLDGDTVILDGDRRIRLLDINTTELAHDGNPEQPYARQAANVLRSMVLGKYVTIQMGPQPKDRFGRWLGHIYMPDGHGGSTWVNGTLVKAGAAHVYTFADNALYAPELLKLEDAARAQRLGLWALPGWQVRQADTCCARDDIGTFKLVEGTVLNGAHVAKNGNGRTYLNFGRDWKSDFTIMVRDTDAKWFKKAGIKDIVAYYKGKHVVVHGYLQPINGVEVRVTHPAQIEIVD